MLLMLVLVGLGFSVSHKRELDDVKLAMEEVINDYRNDVGSSAQLTAVRRGPSRNELIIDLESDVTDLKFLPRRLLKVAREEMQHEDMEIRLQIKHVLRTGGR